MIELLDADPMEVVQTRREPGSSGRQMRTQLRWMRTVKVGDVLESGSGAHRVVRGVHRYKNGDLRCVDFAIKHRSWTGRPWTSLSFTDLRMYGYRPTGVQVALDSHADLALEFAILSSPDNHPVISLREAMDLP